LDDKYTTFEQLMPLKKDYCILLIESESNSGHWVCMMRNGNAFEYFDPYGLTHKKAMDWTSEYMNKFLDNTYSDLGTLIQNMKPNQTLKTNNIKYQNMKFLNNVATCGRWTILRLQSFLMINHTNDDFEKFIKNQCKLYALPSDVIAVMLTPINI
jgi:hypothetical protein